MSRKKIDPHYYIINEFRHAHDNRFWKLHWFGQLDFNLQNLEPLIETTLVPLTDTRLDPDGNPPELLDNDSFDFSQSRTVYVGVGQLPLFGLGVFFQRGRPVSRPNYTSRVFKDLDVNARTWRHITAKGSRKVGKDPVSGKELWKYYIDFGEYQLKGLNLDAKCLLLNVPPPDPDGITQLIIPCVEIVRFHYANSSEMLREMFTGGAIGTPNRVFNASRTVRPDSTGHNGYVQLSKFIRDEDAPIIARLAFDPYALAEANHIYKSSLNSYARIRQYIPEARLPFTETQATLVVHGKIVHSGTERYFLVYWIERCSGPFPFQTFEFERDNSGIKVGTNPRRPHVSWPHPPSETKRKIVRSRTKGELIRSDVEPSGMKKLVRQLLIEKRFVDLEKKSWRKRPEEESTDQWRPDEEVVVRNPEDASVLSTAPTSGDSTVTPITIVTEVAPNSDPDVDVTGSPNIERAGSGERTAAIPASFHDFRSIIFLLSQQVTDLTCEVVEVPERGDAILRHHAPSQFPVKLGRKNLSWSSVMTPSGVRERRRVLVAEGVYIGARHFYMMEIEPEQEKKKKGKKERTYTMLMVYSTEQFKALDAEDLREVLARCAKNKGAWLKKSEIIDLGWYKFKHTSKSHDIYVDRIVEELKAAGLLM